MTGKVYQTAWTCCASVEGGDGKRHIEPLYAFGPPQLEKLQEHDFGAEDLQLLSDAVDGFSLLTYDFFNPQNPGSNAPLTLIRSKLQLLLAKGSGGAIIGRDYLSLLEKHKPLLQWEKKSVEHLFFYSDFNNKKHAVFYPWWKKLVHEGLASPSGKLAKVWITFLTLLLRVGQIVPLFFPNSFVEENGFFRARSVT